MGAGVYDHFVNFLFHHIVISAGFFRNAGILISIETLEMGNFPSGWDYGSIFLCQIIDRFRLNVKDKKLQDSGTQ